MATKNKLPLFKPMKISANNANYSDTDFNQDFEIRFNVEKQRRAGFHAFEEKRTTLKYEAYVPNNEVFSIRGVVPLHQCSNGLKQWECVYLCDCANNLPV